MAIYSLAVKGLSSLLQHHNSEASILWHSAFFIVQLSHLYVTTEKPQLWTVCVLVSRVISLLLNTPFSILNQSAVLYLVLTVAS